VARRGDPHLVDPAAILGDDPAEEGRLCTGEPGPAGERPLKVRQAATRCGGGLGVGGDGDIHDAVLGLGGGGPDVLGGDLPIRGRGRGRGRGRARARARPCRGRRPRSWRGRPCRCWRLPAHRGWGQPAPWRGPAPVTRWHPHLPLGDPLLLTCDGDDHIAAAQESGVPRETVPRPDPDPRHLQTGPRVGLEPHPNPHPHPRYRATGGSRASP
jgi:hypothetical protein